MPPLFVSCSLESPISAFRQTVWVYVPYVIPCGCLCDVGTVCSMYRYTADLDSGQQTCNEFHPVLMGGATSSALWWRASGISVYPIIPTRLTLPIYSRAFVKVSAFWLLLLHVDLQKCSDQHAVSHCAP